MINHKLKFIFTHIPKTGGVSLCSHFRSKSKGHHRTSDQIQICADEGVDADEYFKFSFVRNPWDRFVSAYSYLSKGGNNASDRRIRDEFIKPFDSFSEFVHGVDMEPLMQQVHFRPQSYWLDREVDFVGRFENYEPDLQRVCEKIDYPFKGLPHKNKSKHKPYWEYYDDASVDAVGRQYAKDVETFGYDFSRDQVDAAGKGKSDRSFGNWIRSLFVSS